MGTLQRRDQETARKKGIAAAAATGSALALMVIGAPVLGTLALIPAAYLGWDWFNFRAKRGMRF